MDLTISVIGFGNIGKFVSALLLTHRAHRIHLNVVDTDWQVYGAILDLKHGIQLFPGHEISYNDQEALNRSDFIFHCAGASVPRGKSRLITCQASIEITEAIFKDFNPTKEPFIIVVANPVEIITFITQKITGLPRQNVMGTGTYLDSIRMNYVIRDTNKDIGEVDAILLGEHGTTVFLSEQLSTINGQPFRSKFDKDTIDELMILVKASAEEIKETQEATIYGVSYCAVQLFEALMRDEPLIAPVSTFLPESLKRELGNTSIALSLYSQINKYGVHPKEDYVPGDHEKECLKRSIELITPCIPDRFFEA